MQKFSGERRHDQTPYCSCARAVVACRTSALAEASFPTAGQPEEVGLSAAQLKRIEEVTKANIAQGYMPGAIMLVARKGKVAWSSVQGKLDGKGDKPMTMDAIFRIYSMTKPIVNIALMQMVEEGKLQVSDPVSKFLPEFKDVKVGVEKDGKLELVAPKRAMTVQDLMRHTSGLTYGNRGTSAVYKAYVEAKIGNRDVTSAEFITKLASLPLLFHPGDRWDYSVSVDVQGRILEVLSGGKPLAEVLEERVTGPLNMKDTKFWVPQENMARAAQAAQRPGAPPMRTLLRHGRARQVPGRRWRHGRHDRGLSALRHDAGQRRRAAGQADHRQEDARVHDRRPCRQPAGPSARPGLRSRLRGAHARGRLRHCRARSASMAGRARRARCSGSIRRKTLSRSTW